MGQKMTWTVTTYRDTISSTDINNNFYHVAEGALLPKLGTNFTATNLRSNIGDKSYRWNNLYCNELHINSKLIDGWELVSEYNVTTGGVSTIEISGLDSEVDKQYMIYGVVQELWAAGGDNSIRMYFNNDSTSADKNFIGHSNWSSITAGGDAKPEIPYDVETGNSLAYIPLLWGDINANALYVPSFFRAYLDLSNNNNKTYVVSGIVHQSTTALRTIWSGAGYWSDRNSIMSTMSFKFSNASRNFESGTSFFVYRRAS